MATLKGSYKALNTLSAATQANINAGQSLVVVREVSTSTRVSGTMWYKGKVIGFTVEDARRTSKIDKQTCIPPSRYNLVLRSTNNDLLKNHEVQIPGLGKVFAAIGTDSAGIALNGPGNLDFAGIRIHYGHSETFSAGCILFGPEKYSDGTILKDLQTNIDLTWLIYNDKIKLIDVIDEFQGAANFTALNGAPGITTTNAGGGETGSLAGGASIASTPSFSSPFEALSPQLASQKSTEIKLDGETYDVFVYQLSVANPQDQLKDTIFDVGQQVYLPLRDIVKLLNKYILIKDFKSKTPIVEISLTEGDYMDNPNRPLLCLGNPLQLSVNPAVCLIKNDAWLNPEASLGVKLPYDPTTLKGIITNLKQSYWYGTNYKSQPLAVIQNIYVNLGYVFSLVTSKEMESQDRREKNDIYVFDFLRTLMQNINTAIGNIANFDIFIDPQDGKARIIDVNYVDTKSRETSWEEAYELQVHNLKSTVRNYSFESQIFNDQTAVVAIGAQTTGGALGQNVNSLVDFNQNLRDRIVPSRQAPPPTNPGNTEQQLREQLKNLKESITILGSYIIQLDIGDLGLGGSFDAKNSSKYSNALKDIISFLTSILKSDTKNRAIIPTKLSLEMDGIGGIGIGNIFKIPLELLPRGYKGDGAGPAKIGYVVTGLSHNVDGNNWKTKIESQFIILDPPRGLDIDLASIQSDVINITITEEPIQINSLISSIRNLQNSVAAASTSTSTFGGGGGSISLEPSTRLPTYGQLVDVNTLDISPAGLSYISTNEGWFDKVYDDKRGASSPLFYLDSYDSPTKLGYATIGYGTLIDTAQEREQFAKYLKNTPDKLTKEEGIVLFKKELDDHRRYWVSRIKKPISQNMYDALASHAYNAGPGNETLRAAINLINSGDYRGASAKLGSAPTTSKGTVLKGLVRRRGEEKELFLLNYTG
jgi:GH24 family phage-related lysozyme (muramidase)